MGVFILIIQILVGGGDSRRFFPGVALGAPRGNEKGGNSRKFLRQFPSAEQLESLGALRSEGAGCSFSETRTRLTVQLDGGAAHSFSVALQISRLSQRAR